jgi:hypothetical protein
VGPCLTLRSVGLAVHSPHPDRASRAISIVPAHSPSPETHLCVTNAEESHDPVGPTDALLVYSLPAAVETKAATCCCRAAPLRAPQLLTTNSVVLSPFHQHRRAQSLNPARFSGTVTG